METFESLLEYKALHIDSSPDITRDIGDMLDIKTARINMDHKAEPIMFSNPYPRGMWDDSWEYKKKEKVTHHNSKQQLDPKKKAHIRRISKYSRKLNRK